MITIDPSRFNLKPFKHQLVGTSALVRHPYFALFDEMGVGKTKQTIDAACVLFDNSEIDTVVIACPAQVKTVWLDPDLGEIQKHAWVESVVHHFHGKTRDLRFGRGLIWIVVSYELIRQDPPLNILVKLLRGRETMLVMDESIFLKSPKASQTKQTYELSLHCKRRYLLNGTPIGNNLLDLYCQFKMLSPEILQCKSYFHFRARYAIMGGFKNKQIVGFKNAEEVNRLTAPYVLRRLKEDCLDLPPKTYSHMTVALTPENWKKYKSMRDDMVVWLGSDACMVRHAPVKALRLGQITSGFLGGITEMSQEEWALYGIMDGDPIMQETGETRTEEIGREKLDGTMDWLERRFDENGAFRTIIWCRFRPELDRIYDEIRGCKNIMRTGVHLHSIRGQQSKRERTDAVREGMAGTGPAIILGQPHAGGLGLNLTTLPNVMYISSDYSLLARLQSEDRVHRPGQTQNVGYTDVIATGPDGQKTIDHAVIKALRNKENLADWTTDRWRSALLEE